MQIRSILSKVSQKAKYDYRKVLKDSFSKIHIPQQPEMLYNSVLMTIQRLFNANGASLMLRDPISKQHALRASVGNPPLSYCVPYSNPFLMKLTQWGKPLFKNDLMSEPFFRDVKDVGLRLYLELHAEVLIPMNRLSGFFGMIGLGRRRIDYDEEDRELMRMLSSEIALAVENSYLFEEIQRQKTRLNKFVELKSDFLSSSSHELTTPLHNIIGLAQVMAEGSDGKVSEQQVEHLRMIEAAGNKLLSVLETVLNLSSLEGGSSENFKIKKVDLKKMITQMILLETGGAPKAYLKILENLGSRAMWVYGDDEKIEEVLTILLGNSLKNTKRGTIEIRSERMGEMVRISVQDSGSGIPYGDLEKIFEEFGQVGDNMLRGEGGAGLGLAVAKKIVELHGGRIWAESSPGMGSCFHFTLPTKPSLINSRSI